MAHYDEMTCMQYLDGQLERTRATELAAHAETCGECRRLLGALERESRLLHEALVEEDEAVPARVLAPPSPEKTSWAWITALGLAAAGVYWVWTDWVNPGLNNLSQAGFGEGNLLTLLFFGGVFWKGWSDMLNLVQVLATGTLVILGLGLLSRLGRRWTTVAMVVSGVAGALLLPGGAAAAELRHDKQTYVLAEGETVKNDLIVASGIVKIDGNIEGDLIVFCQSLTVNGKVSGDIIGFAQSIRIEGTVEGNLRVFANNITLGGSVNRNLMSFTQSFETASKSQVGGGAILFGETLTLGGKIGRDLLSFGARTYLNGSVGGDAQTKGERLSIGPTAEIIGKAKFKGAKPAEVDPKAKLGSPLEFEEIKNRPDYATPRFYWRQALRWGAAFVLGLVLMFLFPGFFRSAVRTGDRIGASAVAGLIALFLVPVVAIISCITVVGLAVGIISVVAWVALIYSAQVFFGAWLGSKLLGDTRLFLGATKGDKPVGYSEGAGALLARLALGLFIVRIFGNIPWIGGWVWFAVIILGMGIFLLSWYDGMRQKPLAV